jgi:hypothetical protein
MRQRDAIKKLNKIYPKGHKSAEIKHSIYCDGRIIIEYMLYIDHSTCGVGIVKYDESFEKAFEELEKETNGILGRKV